MRLKSSCSSFTALASLLLMGAFVASCGEDDRSTSSEARLQDAMPKWTVPEDGLTEIQRELIEGMDVSNPLIEIADLLTPGVPRDGIPALVNPERASASGAEFPGPNDRVVEVRLEGEAIAYPLKILNYHEIANDVIGEIPIAVTYCPLCDSVSVFDRRTTTEAGEEQVLEFGVSGFLFNSNVVMYERTTMTLWSQVLMQAITGPNSGASLTHLPFRVISFAEFQAANKGGHVLTMNTGHERAYTANPYASYMGSGRMFHDFETDDRLPPHTLGLGIRAGEQAWFVIADAAADAPIIIDAPTGSIEVRADEAGVHFESLPDGVSALQTYYHSWAAYHPHTLIVPDATTWQAAQETTPESEESSQ